jgi:hypothetical protein
MDEGTNEAQINSDKLARASCLYRKRVRFLVFLTGRYIRGKEFFKYTNFIKLKSNASTSAFAVVANENENENET